MTDANAGITLAQYQLADAYERGDGVQKNKDEAIRWLKLAAQNGHPNAHYQLGLAYQRGISFQSDAKIAFELFAKGAGLGDIQCQCALADAFRDGRSVEKNEAEAVRWYIEAAKQGSAHAQYRLGKIFRYGTGTPRDIKTAIRYFEAASEQGHEEAKSALEKTKQAYRSYIQARSTENLKDQEENSSRRGKRSIPLVMIDTSVLLKDPDVIRRVIGNKGIPCITNTILAEIDHNKKHKDRSVAKNASEILRELAKGDLKDIKEIPGGGGLLRGDAVKEYSFKDGVLLVFSRDHHHERSNNDGKIINVAKDYEMIIITADAGLKVRAQTAGIEGFIWSGSDSSGGNSRSDQDGVKDQEVQPFNLRDTPVVESAIPLVVTSLPNEGDVVRSNHSGDIRLIKKISAGGEGTIYETNISGVVCKVYHKDRLTSLRQKKIELMLSRKINREGICWPTDAVKNKAGQFVGFLMPKAQGKPMQHSVFRKPALEKSFPDWSRIDLVNLCNSFLEQVSFLHRLNIFIGDINPLNILVTENSNRVWLVDTDSFQIEGFPCPVGTVNFTAPEIQGNNFSSFLRSKEHELFAVATMIFMILHPGKPPYSQQGGGDPAENIKKQNFAYPFGQEKTGKAPEGPWQYIWANLPQKVREAFWNTFKRNKRLEVNDWINLLRLYRREIPKNWHSNEIFPTSFKVTDPIDVICGNCSQKVKASGKRYHKMIGDGKPFYCGQCVANIRLQILASKAREAHKSVKNSQGKNTNPRTYSVGRTSQYKQKQYSSLPSHSGGGFWDTIFNIFRL